MKNALFTYNVRFFVMMTDDTIYFMKNIGYKIRKIKVITRYVRNKILKDIQSNFKVSNYYYTTHNFFSPLNHVMLSN